MLAGLSTATAQTDISKPHPTSDAVVAKAGVPREAVAAVVDDTVITTFDVRQRMRMALLSAGGRVPPEALPQLRDQALRELIQEKLKLKETEKFEMEFSDAEFKEEFQYMAAQSNMNPGDLEAVLSSQGISMNVLREQIKSGTLWPRLVQGRFRDRVRISDDEVSRYARSHA